MAIPQNRLSTTPVTKEFVLPDSLDRVNLNEDFESGPIALNDPSQGLSYQTWHLTWDSGTGNFIVIPETVGAPTIILNAANITQCSFSFDQNGHVNLAFTQVGIAKLYWYDTDVASWVTTSIGTGVNSPTLTLDDKRTTQTQSSDILLWYTKQQVDGSWNLYKKEQRERYLIEQLMKTGTYPFIHKLGMHGGLRVQLYLKGSP